jgi:D-alanyl-D-alanine carboxypeptidase/D-alanyl-D-alanine-endopeptidase (penicillin-binding protein 4)
MERMKLRSLLLAAAALPAASAVAQSPSPLAGRIEAVMARPEFRHALFGVEIYSPSEDRVLYAHNADKLFVPGSVTKILTEGTVLRLLGPDYRFHTPVYRTGPVSAAGVLQGDLVLVASGDPNLSQRVRPDGTLAFEDADHAYGHVLEATLVPGDPLQVLRSLARQVAAAGVKRVSGRVLVDATLFPEKTREGGSGVVISPVAVNDNVIDVVVTPGKAAGDAATVAALPETTYAAFESEVETVAPGGESAIAFAAEPAPSGGLRVRVRGAVKAGSAPRPFPFAVPEPSRFAQAAFSDALRQLGIEIADAPAPPPDWKELARAYGPGNRLAEHVSPPLREDVKVTLKVSQNLHAAMMPYVLGALGGAKGGEAVSAGFAQERAFLAAAGLDLSGAVQSDGAGGDAYFTPDFVVRFLAFMDATEGARFREALPVLGRDGTLSHTLRDSPVAGKIRAKTGTHVTGDLLNEQYVVNGKGLAGYLDAADGRRLVFAVFVNHVPAGADMKAVLALGDALAEIAAAAYDSR